MKSSVMAKLSVPLVLAASLLVPAGSAAATPVPGNVGNRVADYTLRTWPTLDDTSCGTACFSLNYATVPATPAPKYWEYTNGVPLYGMWKLYERTGRQKYFNYVKQFVDTYVGADGTISYARAFPAGSTPNDPTVQDTIQPATLLFGLYTKTKDPRYLKAMTSVFALFPTLKANPQGAWWHKPTYPDEQWLDAIYMSQPFLVRYAATLADPAERDAAFATATQQIKLAAEHTFDPATGLYRHGWNGATDGVWRGLDPTKGKTPPLTGQVTSPVAWSRSMAWFVTGIVDVLEYLPANNPDRQALLDILTTSARSLQRYQDARTGLWYQVLDVKDGPLPSNGGYPGEEVAAQPNFLETSSSALFVYSLAKAVRLHLLPREYLSTATKGWAGVKSRIDTSANGRSVTVHGTVVGMSLGGTYNAYTNVDVRSDLTSGALPAPADTCSAAQLPTNFTSAPLACKFSYVRDNVPQGLGGVMLAASEMEY